MATIIGLEAPPNRGKTTTIGILFELLKSNDFTIRQDKKKPGSKDFFVIVEKKGKLIGVSTYGDNVKLIIEKLDFFSGKNCNMIITACRPNGPIKNAVEDYPGYSKYFVVKTIVNDSASALSANTTDANTLLREIENRL